MHDLLEPTIRPPADPTTPPRSMADAPRDGTMVWLLVDYSTPGAMHALVQTKRHAWTLGFNNFENDGEDEWKFAGWCWRHDHFAEGDGSPIAWKHIGFPLEWTLGMQAADSFRKGHH